MKYGNVVDGCYNLEFTPAQNCYVASDALVLESWKGPMVMLIIFRTLRYALSYQQLSGV